MSRWISFFVLVAVIVVISAFFLRVMAEFLVPLFVASILIVLFRPVHLWLMTKIPNRPTLTAILTTTAMIMAVVLPAGFLMVFAAAEGNEMVRRFDMATISRKLQDVRKSFDLEIPRSTEWTDYEEELGIYRSEVLRITKESTTAQNGLIKPAQFLQIENNNKQLTVMAESLGANLGLKWPELQHDPQPSEQPTKTPQDPSGPAAGGTDNASDKSPAGDENESEGEGEEEKEEAPVGENPAEQAWFDFVFSLTQQKKTLKRLGELTEKVDSEYLKLEEELTESASDSLAKFRDFKIVFLGGSTLTLVKEMVNPKPEELDKYTKSGVNYLTSALLSWGGTATVFIGRLVFGSIIVVIAFYFFLVDGPGMMQTLMQLSPMDDRHEQELIDEFERVSRAVVLATLAAAVAQGLLAGIGFYFAGVPSVFLLTLLTMLLAMIPFVGAAAVWVPVCVYLFLFENQIVTASVLAAYSFLIVSSADNVIKPLILHGQSNLHPLLALLSVLGGVTALGPIGIVIGPMLVVFLQTLLGILRDELVDWDRSNQDGDPILAAVTGSSGSAASQVEKGAEDGAQKQSSESDNSSSNERLKPKQNQSQRTRKGNKTSASKRSPKKR